MEKHPICPACHYRHDYQKICPHLSLDEYIGDEYDWLEDWNFGGEFKDFPRSISVYRPTNNYWAGNFKHHYVRMSFYGHPDPETREGSLVCMWGTDDCGWEQRFDTFQEGLDMFNKLQGFFTIDWDTIEKLGFHHA